MGYISVSSGVRVPPCDREHWQRSGGLARRDGVAPSRHASAARRCYGPPMPAPARALVLAGRGRYEDPWHDHAATSHVVAGLLAGQGVEASVRGTFPDAFGDLAAF